MPTIERTYEDIRAFARARGVGRVVLFGSRARGDNAPKSDLDIAFSGGDAAGFEEDLQERLWSLLMDVNTLEGLDDFRAGFRLGAALMLEALGEEE